MIKFHTEPGVYFCKLITRPVNHDSPNIPVFRTGTELLELYQFLTTTVQNFGIRLTFSADFFVKAFHFAKWISIQSGAESRLILQVFSFPPKKEHSKLRSPIANVIVGDDAMAEQPQRARKAIAEDRRADVADVHRLGHVRRAEINDSSSWNRHLACLRLS